MVLVQAAPVALNAPYVTSLLVPLRNWFRESFYKSTENLFRTMPDGRLWVQPDVAILVYRPKGLMPASLRKPGFAAAASADPNKDGVLEVGHPGDLTVNNELGAWHLWEDPYGSRVCANTYPVTNRNVMRIPTKPEWAEVRDGQSLQVGIMTVPAYWDQRTGARACAQFRIVVDWPGMQL